MYTMLIAFQLQPLIKTRYTVRPQSGIISPLAMLTIEIVYHLPPGSNLLHSFPHYDDSILLHSMVVPGAAIKEPLFVFNAVPNDLFTTKKKQVFIDSGIKIMFIGSPVLAQLVADGSLPGGYQICRGRVRFNGLIPDERARAPEREMKKRD
jgi:hypothetical protein